MKKGLKNLFYITGAVLIVLFLVVFFKYDSVMTFDFPDLNLEEMAAQEEAHKQSAQAAALRVRAKRIFSCEADEDCIIVDKDPCGCLVGPTGVTSINVNHILDFNETQKTITKACPDTPTSTQKECSPSAHAVCRKNTCTIVF